MAQEWGWRRVVKSAVSCGGLDIEKWWAAGGGILREKVKSTSNFTKQIKIFQNISCILIDCHSTTTFSNQQMFTHNATFNVAGRKIKQD